MISTNKNILKLIASKSTLENKIITIEELSELQKEITKDLRGYERKNEIKEEIVDVYICLQMLKEIYNFSDEELEKEYEKKLNRNLNRIKEKEIKQTEKEIVFSSPEECIKHFIQTKYEKGNFLFKQAVKNKLEKYNLIPKDVQTAEYIEEILDKLVQSNILKNKFKFNEFNDFYCDVEHIMFDSKEDALEYFENIDEAEFYTREPRVDKLYVII